MDVWVKDADEYGRGESMCLYIKEASVCRLLAMGFLKLY